jgi:hypothetical protein
MAKWNIFQCPLHYDSHITIKVQATRLGELAQEITNMSNVKGTALITGASTGIGRSMQIGWRNAGTASSS